MINGVDVMGSKFEYPHVRTDFFFSCYSNYTSVERKKRRINIMARAGTIRRESKQPVPSRDKNARHVLYVARRGEKRLLYDPDPSTTRREQDQPRRPKIINGMEKKKQIK